MARDDMRSACLERGPWSIFGAHHAAREISPTPPHPRTSRSPWAPPWPDVGGWAVERDGARAAAEGDGSCAAQAAVQLVSGCHSTDNPQTPRSPYSRNEAVPVHRRHRSFGPRACSHRLGGMSFRSPSLWSCSPARSSCGVRHRGVPMARQPRSAAVEAASCAGRSGCCALTPAPPCGASLWRASRPPLVMCRASTEVHHDNDQDVCVRSERLARRSTVAAQRAAPA